MESAPRQATQMDRRAHATAEDEEPKHQAPAAKAVELAQIGARSQAEEKVGDEHASRNEHADAVQGLPSSAAPHEERDGAEEEKCIEKGNDESDSDPLLDELEVVMHSGP